VPKRDVKKDKHQRCVLLSEINKPSLPKDICKEEQDVAKLPKVMTGSTASGGWEYVPSEGW